MNNIQLEQLELTNYRNIEFAIYNFNGNSKIIGDNRIGKTNTLESIYWLLTDKLLDGSSDIAQIKPLKDTKLEVRVKATFNVNGKQITLEKDYKESWVKTRGTTELVFKGHETKWIYNGVNQPNLTSYNQLLSQDFGIEQDNSTKINFMQMLVNPFYLGNIGESKDWTDLRSFIIKLIGDVNDDDVIKANPQFSPIANDLVSVNGRVDQLKKKYAGDIESFKTSIISDEAQIKLLEETPNPTDDEVAVAKEGINKRQDKIVALKNSNGVDVVSMDLLNKINSKKTEIADLENKDLLKAQESGNRKELNDKINEKIKERNALYTSKHNKEFGQVSFDVNLRKEKTNLEELEHKRSNLIEQLKKIDSDIANPDFEKVCPHCGREYPENEIEIRKNASITKLTETKESIIRDGKETKARIEQLKVNIQEIEKDIEANEKSIDEDFIKIAILDREIDDLQAQLDNNKVVIEPNPQIAVLKEEVVKLETEYQTSRENFAKGIQDNQQLIFDEEEAIKPYQKVLDDRAYYERQIATLKEVKGNYNLHTQNLTDVEQKKELLGKFVYTKLQMLDANVKKVFGNIKFQLIKENINGGYDPICKPYIFDSEKNESTTTTWKSGSKSERVITGIAIAEKIKEHLGLPNLPYLFDEGGEISTNTFATKFKTESQIICVKVVDNINKPMVQKL